MTTPARTGLPRPWMPQQSGRRGYRTVPVFSTFSGESANDTNSSGTVNPVSNWPSQKFTVFDPSKPDGMPRKVLDVGKLHDLGWKYTTDLRDGITTTYQWFLDNQTSLRGL